MRSSGLRRTGLMMARFLAAGRSLASIGAMSGGAGSPSGPRPHPREITRLPGLPLHRCGCHQAVPDKIAASRGFPQFIRCDNGSELTAAALRDWCRFTRAGTSYIEPGSPWQNPWWSPTTGGCAANSWRSSSSAACWKPRFLSPAGEMSTTLSVPTRPWACSP